MRLTNYGLELFNWVDVCNVIEIKFWGKYLKPGFLSKYCIPLLRTSRGGWNHRSQLLKNKGEREESEVKSIFHYTRDSILKSCIAYYEVGKAPWLPKWCTTVWSWWSIRLDILDTGLQCVRFYPKPLSKEYSVFESSKRNFAAFRLEQKHA